MVLRADSAQGGCCRLLAHLHTIVHRASAVALSSNSADATIARRNLLHSDKSIQLPDVLAIHPKNSLHRCAKHDNELGITGEDSG